MTGVVATAEAVVHGDTTATLHRRWISERPGDYADQVRARIAPGLFCPATHYVEALMRRGQIAAYWIAACCPPSSACRSPA